MSARTCFHVIKEGHNISYSISIYFFAFFAWLQGMNPADYLDVDSPFQRGNKKSKKRRKVERNTKLSRSLDSLKELHGK